jgi:hypothetical protein
MARWLRVSVQARIERINHLLPILVQDCVLAKLYPSVCGERRT